MGTVIILKIMTLLSGCYNFLEISLCYILALYSKIVDGMANSVDFDQTGPQGFV